VQNTLASIDILAMFETWRCFCLRAPSPNCPSSTSPVSPTSTTHVHENWVFSASLMVKDHNYEDLGLSLHSSPAIITQCHSRDPSPWILAKWPRPPPHRIPPTFLSGNEITCSSPVCTSRHTRIIGGTYPYGNNGNHWPSPCLEIVSDLDLTSSQPVDVATNIAQVLSSFILALCLYPPLRQLPFFYWVLIVPLHLAYVSSCWTICAARTPYLVDTPRITLRESSWPYFSFLSLGKAYLDNHTHETCSGAARIDKNLWDCVC